MIRAVLLAGCVLAFSGTAAAQVSLISRGPDDHAVLLQLGGMLEEPLSERVESEPRGLGAIMDDARASWPERYVVVIDRGGDSVHVLRPGDRTSASRVLAPEVLAQSPYAVALTIAELLEWLGATPRSAQGPPAVESNTGQPDAPATVATSEPPADEERLPSAVGMAVTAGLELGASPSADLALTRLALGLEGQLLRGRQPLWFALAARFSAPASIKRELDPALRSPEADALEYHSMELALQPVLGFGQHASALAVGPFVGLSPVRVAVLADDGTTTNDKDLLVGFAGLGVRLRHPIALGFALDLSAEAELLFKPVRYRVTGRAVLDDGPLRAQTRLGVVWESAFAP